MGPREATARWQDLSLLVEGPVTEHLSDIFKSDWTFASKETLDDRKMTLQASGQAGSGLTQTGLAQLIASGPDVSGDSLRNALLTAIFRATCRIWIVTPYFVPDELFLEALCLASARRIDVSIIIPHNSNHRLADMVREGYLTRVQENGAAVWLYEPSMLHAKAILIDDALAIVGSANMDIRSFLLNYEIALCLYDTDAIRRLETWMAGLKRDCFSRELRSQSSWGLLESVGRLLAPLL